jgi:hypothetical protein
MDGGDEGAVGHAQVTAVPRSGGGGSGGLPGTRAEWVTVRGQVSGLLLALREAEATAGASVPAPLSGGRALRAWGYLAPGLRPGSRRVAGSVADLALLGRAARVLGQRLCRARVSGTDDADDPVVQVLRREADVHDVAPERLVAQLARVHGVLSAPSPASAAAVWWALDTAPSDPSRRAG